MRALLLAVCVAVCAAAPASAGEPGSRCAHAVPRGGWTPARVERVVRCAGRVTPGVSPGEMVSVGRCESGLRRWAENGRYKSVFMHDEDRWPARARKHGFPGASIWDPLAQSFVTARAVRYAGWEAWDCKP